MNYDALLKEADEEDVDVVELNFRNSCKKGLYSSNTIALNKHLCNSNEKCCILAEELGHHYTSSGQILNLEDVTSVKQEKRARNWAYIKLVGIIDIVNAHRSGVKNRYELAEYLSVTEEFLQEALNYYKQRHGLYYEIDNYFICFDPLGIGEKFKTS